MASDLSSNVVAGPEASVLRAISSQGVGLTLWWRRLSAPVLDAISELLDKLPFSYTVVDRPREASTSIADLVGMRTPSLSVDIEQLSLLLSNLSGSSLVRLRLEHTTERSFPRLHVDSVQLQMLCTYAGRGIEWQDRWGTIRRMPAGHVAMLKGASCPGENEHWLVPYRSPSIADLPPAKQGRLLLCIDRPELH